MYAIKSILAIATLLGTTAVQGYKFNIVIPDNFVGMIVNDGEIISISDGSQYNSKFDIPTVGEPKVLTWLLNEPDKVGDLAWNVTIEATVTKAYDDEKTAVFRLSNTSPWLTATDDLDSTTLVTKGAECPRQVCEDFPEPKF